MAGQSFVGIAETACPSSSWLAMKGPDVKWDKQDIEQLRLDVEAGRSASHIAAKLKRTSSSVSAKAQALGLKLWSVQAEILRERLKGGTHILREDLGQYGIRYTTAQRSGEWFVPEYIEALIRTGQAVETRPGIYVGVSQ